MTIANRIYQQAGSKAVTSGQPRGRMWSPAGVIAATRSLRDWSGHDIGMCDWMPGGQQIDGRAGSEALRYDQRDPCILGSIMDVHPAYGGPTVLYMGDPTSPESVMQKAYIANPAACVRHLLLPPIDRAWHPRLEAVVTDKSGAIGVGNAGHIRETWDFKTIEAIGVPIGTEHPYRDDLPIVCDERSWPSFRGREFSRAYVMIGDRLGASIEHYASKIAPFMADPRVVAVLVLGTVRQAGVSFKDFVDMIEQENTDG